MNCYKCKKEISALEFSFNDLESKTTYCYSCWLERQRERKGL